MISRIIVCGAVGVLVASTVKPAAQAPAAPRLAGGWQLVWQDEFEGARLSPAKWNVLLREDSKHGELQYYVPDEAFVEKGSLRLRSRVRDFGSKHYTSARVDTSGKFAPTYGRFEIRARLPAGKGVWPAHWLYPQDRDWAMEMRMLDAIASGRETLIPEHRPWYTEIDIMEFLGHEPNTVYGTYHYYTFDGRKQASSGTHRADADFSKDFHVFVLEWEPDGLRWYVDGQLIHWTATRVPHTPHYLILNTAVGGSWPGNPDQATVFPQYHDIDYVRVYQRPPHYESAGVAPRLFLAGDSTMADKPLDLPERGWGMVLPRYFEDPSIVHNHAVNGRSTKSFIDERRWQGIVEQLREGDVVIVQFGHNDEKKEDPARYTDPETTFRDNLRRFVHDVRARKASPILATPVARRKFDSSGVLTATHGEYPDAVRAIAAEAKVPLLDLERATSKWLQEVGDEPSKRFFMWIQPGRYPALPDGRQDDTHFVEAGAAHVAELAIAEMRAQKLAVVEWLK